MRKAPKMQTCSYSHIVEESGRQFPNYTSTPNSLGDATSSLGVSREMVYYPYAISHVLLVTVHQSGELEELLAKYNIIPKADEEAAAQATSS